MKRLLIPTLAAFLTLSATGALAAEATDKIKSIDREANTVMLDDGRVYTFPPRYDLSEVSTGDDVDITFETSDGMQIHSDNDTKNMATDIVSAE